MIENSLEQFNKENLELSSNNMDKIILDINLKLDLLDKAENPYQVNDKVVKNILDNRTDGIKFSQILFNKQSQVSKTVFSPILEIHGVATNRDALRNFKTILDANSNYSKVDLPISNFLEKTDLPFIITITMK